MFRKINNTTSRLFSKLTNSNGLFQKVNQGVGNETKDIFQSAYLPQKEAANNLEKHHYERDPQHSTMDTKVFVNKETNQPIIIHRGTKTIKDVFDDALVGVGLGKLSHRHKNAERLTKKLELKYGKAPDLYGHSLGGHLAENSGTKGNIITYNKAVGIGDIGKKLGHNQLDIRTKGDIISLPSYLQSGAKRKIIENKNKNPNALNAHSTKNLYS